ncbi:protein NRT1/ PTR FAMILY 5.10-like [Carica papaya]|uniref:protein NRT1/ PTR FAMILY 5.10-like n=1 Tax=Carica papaya TaxID=3649 RepID=UPI000B8C75D2|nr:protein NRT1/ PTR FAMILY 5.10-like [Carica papaya]
MPLSDSVSGGLESQSPLLQDTVDGSVDYKGRPVLRSSSGGWRSAFFIFGVEIAERFAFYGIGLNLISYLTGPLGQSTADAAANVNLWSGTASLLPLLGALLADSFLGRYRTILMASIIYISGLAILTLSAMLPTLGSPDCKNTDGVTTCSSRLQVILFFFSLYIVAVGQSGHKPCVQAFGADQFDVQDPEECKAKSSFFNWWYFALCAGTTLTLLVSTYIQDNLNWALGFGIPCISMVIALVIFVLGTRNYRFSMERNEQSAFVRVGRVFVIAFKNWCTTSLSIAVQEEIYETLPQKSSQQFKCLNKALHSPDGSREYWEVCSIEEVEEAKSVLRLIPIWITNLVYAIVFAQTSTFFTKQGVTLDRSITAGFQIPPASLQSFIGFAIAIFIPAYDQILVPVARKFTQNPAGITMLQRIGTGMCLSVICMVIAALVETKRLDTAREHGLIDNANATIPMSIWWLVPQYVILGICDVFTVVGLQEFFYDQVPSELRSVGMSLYLSIFGVGSFLSSFLISAIDKASGREGKDSWFSNNLNRGHLDYFYWVLAGLSFVEFIVYLCFARSYVYKETTEHLCV